MLPLEQLFSVLQNISFSSLNSCGYLRIRSEIAGDKERVEKKLRQRLLKIRKYNYEQQSTLYLANSRETLEKRVSRGCLTNDQSTNNQILPNTNYHNCYRYIKFDFN